MPAAIPLPKDVDLSSEIRETLAALGADGYRLAPFGITAKKLEDVWLPESAYEAQMLLIVEKLDDGKLELVIEAGQQRLFKVSKRRFARVIFA